MSGTPLASLCSASSMMRCSTKWRRDFFFFFIWLFRNGRVIIKPNLLCIDSKIKKTLNSGCAISNSISKSLKFSKTGIRVNLRSTEERLIIFQYFYALFPPRYYILTMFWISTFKKTTYLHNKFCRRRWQPCEVGCCKASTCACAALNTWGHWLTSWGRPPRRARRSSRSPPVVRACPGNPSARPCRWTQRSSHTALHTGEINQKGILKKHIFTPQCC